MLPWRWHCSTHDAATPNETTTTLHSTHRHTNTHHHKHIHIYRERHVVLGHSLSSLSPCPFLPLSLCVVCAFLFCVCKSLYLRLPVVRVVACTVLHWWPHAAATTLALHWPVHGSERPPPPQTTTHHQDHSTLTQAHAHRQAQSDSAVTSRMVDYAAPRKGPCVGAVA